MATLDDLWQLRWNAINPDVTYASDNAIARFWRQHPELGSPLLRRGLARRGRRRASVANGIVQWSPETGPVLVAE